MQAADTMKHDVVAEAADVYLLGTYIDKADTSYARA